MDLNNYFSSLCRETGLRIHSKNPSFKPLFSGRKAQSKCGTVAHFDFDGFSMNIYYIERGRGSYAQQTLWVAFSLEAEPLLPFSVYDILANTQPQNFGCYTYTYVDSQELMKKCFKELQELFKTLLPRLTELLNNGIERNRLIAAQKEHFELYFGSNVLDNSKPSSPAIDKILSLMISNYFENQIEAAVMGGQALFYEGKEEKALKALKKKKYPTHYEQNLLKYIENGGKAEISETVKNASSQKGFKRHKGSKKELFTFIGVWLLSVTAVSAVMFLFFLICSEIAFRGSVYIFGIKENLIFIPLFAMIPAMAVSAQFLRYKNKKKQKESRNKNDTHSLPETAGEKRFYKYFTIFAETVALIGIIISVNSTAVFYGSHFSYSVGDFPLSQNQCSYSAVDFVAVVDGYKLNDGTFSEDKHIVIVTVNGNKIDLSYATYFSAEEFREKTAEFFSEKNIPVKHFKTQEDIK